MYNKRVIAIVVVMAFAMSLHAQNKERMQGYQSRLSALIERVATSPTDNERYLASEDAISVLSAALEEEDSEKWHWDLPNYASVLTSPDGRLRIFTWAVVRDNGEFECFGAVQFYNDKDEEYQYQLLNDKSEDIMNREESLLSADNWLGAVYQDIIQTQTGERTLYTLLGWNGVDNLTERKIIEPIIIRGGVPQFGAAVFRRERNLRRIVLEYSNDAMVQMAYETQVVQEIVRERVKVKGNDNRKSKRFSAQSTRHRTVETVKEHRERMIIFDEVEPQVPGMEGLFQYYVPSGIELAYAFVDGKWELRGGAQGRQKDKRLNKPFEPLPKPTPSYNFGK